MIGFSIGLHSEQSLNTHLSPSSSRIKRPVSPHIINIHQPELRDLFLIVTDVIVSEHVRAAHQQNLRAPGVERGSAHAYPLRLVVHQPSRAPATHLGENLALDARGRRGKSNQDRWFRSQRHMAPMGQVAIARNQPSLLSEEQIASSLIFLKVLKRNMLLGAPFPDEQVLARVLAISTVDVPEPN